MVGQPFNARGVHSAVRKRSIPNKNSYKIPENDPTFGTRTVNIEWRRVMIVMHRLKGIYKNDWV